MLRLDGEARLAYNAAVLGSGGGVAAPRSAQVFVLNSELVGNSAAQEGGAVACAGCQTWLVASAVVGNDAARGGAFALSTAVFPYWEGVGGSDGRLYASGRGCAFVQARLAQGTVMLSGSDSHNAGDVSVKGLTGASAERVAETPMVPPLARWGRTRALRSARQGACLRRALSESSPMPRGMAHGG